MQPMGLGDDGPRIRAVIVGSCRHLTYLLGAAMDCDGGWDIVGEIHEPRPEVRAVAAARPDLVVVDLERPSRRGLRLVRRLRRALDDHQVLAVVSTADTAIGAARAAGADVVLPAHGISGALLAGLRAAVGTDHRAPVLAG